jgi:hypothetical protein
MVRVVDRTSRRVSAFYRRTALQARSRSSAPAGTGPLLVVGPFEKWVQSPYWMTVRMIESVLSDTCFRLVDTTRMRHRELDLGRTAERAFGRDADPTVLFLGGGWLGDAGNTLVNHEGLRKLLDIQDVNLGRHLDVILRAHHFQGFLHRYRNHDADRLCAEASSDQIRGYYWPHYIDPEEHRDRGLAKVHDVCFYGAFHPHVYPLRARLRSLLEREPEGLRVRTVRLEEGLRGARLSKVINQSWLTVADRVGGHDRFVAKYVEIPFSGSCILGDVPTRHRDLFDGRVVEVDLQMSDRTILDTIKGALADRDRLTRMIQALRADMLPRYTLERGRADFWAIMRDFAGLRSRGSKGAAAST